VVSPIGRIKGYTSYSCLLWS